MNKRSATLVAAALVAVLAIGGAAFSLGITGPTASAATERTTTDGQKPIVRTRTKTVVVRRQAPSAALQVVQFSSSNSGPSVSSGSEDAEDAEDNGHEDFDDDGDQGGEDFGDHGDEGDD